MTSAKLVWACAIGDIAEAADLYVDRVGPVVHVVYVLKNCDFKYLMKYFNPFYICVHDIHIRPSVWQFEF